ncbi:hypothetical protein DS745_00665 [Anaerobacillus alkaliphilus]|uniref:ABC transporter periplasmic binding protein yphF n=1 Tax=Anaerobacillus alkaliphilus TaxID=1548597 RepID=A0A4Q0VZV3_9BACI|nr:hypothetical protein [Anaerobacillus alkaliphilus]RXJ04616.1 hypothetical protein DS745_00665 [Anaerobacillus alkaliphilus]
MKKLLLVLIALIFLLSGCLYPSEKRVENQVPYQDQILSVQHAVVQYRLENQDLPVHLRDTETNEFQQYLVNFQRLVPKYLQQPPGNSFENGGVYQYVLVDVEKHPQVKLIDLTITRGIQELQRNVNDYRRKHRFAPVKEVVATGVFLLDYEKLRLKEQPTVRSPFHPDHRLPLYIDGNGQVLVDYSIDLLYALSKFEHNFQEGDDVRSILVDHFPFVPAYSVPYTIKEGKVVFSQN